MFGSPITLTHALTTYTLYESRVCWQKEPMRSQRQWPRSGFSVEVDAAPQWSQELGWRGATPTRGVNLTVFAINLLFPYVAAVLVRLMNLGSGLRRGTLSPLPPPPPLPAASGWIPNDSLEGNRKTMDPAWGQSCAHSLAACWWSQQAVGVW